MSRFVWGSVVKRPLLQCVDRHAGLITPTAAAAAAAATVAARFSIASIDGAHLTTASFTLIIVRRSCFIGDEDQDNGVILCPADALVI